MKKEGTSLIVISGFPGTGKTRLGEYLARELSLPLIHKDGIKESLFDTLGMVDVIWARRLGLASVTILYYVLERHLQVGSSLIVESNFSAEHDTEKMRRLCEKYAVQPIQIFCKTEGHVLMERVRARDTSPERHPGHIFPTPQEQLIERFVKTPQLPLSLEGDLITLDTTDFKNVHYAAVLHDVRTYLSAGRSLWEH